MKARSAKAKGTRLEKWVCDMLRGVGIPARKQPMSGALQDFPHDVCGELPDGRFIVECKSWKHGWRTGDKAMGAADMLVMKRDYGTPAVYMSWEFFARLVGLAAKPLAQMEAAELLGHTIIDVDMGEEPAKLVAIPPPGTEPVYRRINAPQSLLTGKTGKPKPKPRKW